MIKIDKLRKFYITDLPNDRIFILLKEEFHKELFGFIKKYKLKEFNLRFFDNKLNKHTFQQWKNRKHFIPLWFLIGIYQKFNHIFPLNQIELNIKAYKGPSTSSVINNPKFPLKECSRILKVVGHLLGDGCIAGAFGTNLPKGKNHSEYRNFSKELLDSFKKDLTVFGEIRTTFDYNHGHVIVPNSIGYILQHIYKINFDTFNSRIPNIFYKLEPELISAFIRSFADDEAHVYDSSIEFYSANKEFIEDILKLVNLKFPQIKTSVIKINNSTRRNPKYSFSILSESIEDYYNLIGFDHPEKTEDLLFGIKRKKNWDSNRKTKDTPNLIINLLKEKEFTAKEISRKLFLSHGYLTSVLKKLEKENLISRTRKTLHGAWIWRANQFVIPTSLPLPDQKPGNAPKTTLSSPQLTDNHKVYSLEQ